MKSYEVKITPIEKIFFLSKKNPKTLEREKPNFKNIQLCTKFKILLFRASKQQKTRRASIKRF
jgi:hypothetical protein